MFISTEGIILKQVKATSGIRMVLLFSKKYGKISASTTANEKGRTKTALAMRPFTYGNYEIFKNRSYYNINSADVIKSYYGIGEDIDKYMCSSYVLELTDKFLVEEQPNPKLFNLVIDFFESIERRTKKHETLVLAYEIKALKILGFLPQVNQCACCGKESIDKYFSITEGGMLCNDCYNDNNNDRLICNVDFGIVDIIKYFNDNPVKALEKLALDDEVCRKLQRIIKKYMAYHLDINNLKSESFFEGKF